MRKTCPEHGTFEDTLSIDPEMHRIVESTLLREGLPHQGRRADPSARLLHHSTRPRRGADHRPDNRCNMMCNPCFMDANQVGYVHLG